MNQSPQILDTITDQDTLQNVNQNTKHEDCIQQQPFQMQSAPNQNPNNQFRQIPFTFNPGMLPGMQQGMPPSMQNSMPQGMPSGMQTGMPMSMPPGMPMNMPPGMSTGMPTGMSTGMPTGMPQGMPQGMPPGMPGMQTGMPPGMPTGMPPGMPPGMPTGMPPGMPGMQTGMQTGMPPGMPGMPPGMQTGMPPGMPPGMQTGMPPGMPPGMPGMQTGMPPGMQQKMQSAMPPGMPPGMLPGMTSGMPQGMSGMAPTNMFNTCNFNPPNSITQFTSNQLNSNKTTEENQRLKKDIDILNEEKNTLEEQKKQIETDFKKKNKELNDQIWNLKTEVETLQNEQEKSKKQQDNDEKVLKEKIKELQQNIRQKEVLYQELESSAQHEIKKLKYEITNLNNELRNQKETNSSTTIELNQYNKLKEEVQNLKKQNQESLVQIKTKDHIIEQQKQQIDVLNQVKPQQNQDQQIITRLQQDLSKLDQQINNLSQENKHLQGMKNNIENECKNLLTQIEISQIEISQYKKNEEILKDSLDQSQKLLEKYSKNNSNDQAKAYEEQLRLIQENRENKNKMEQEKFTLEKERIMQRHQQENQKQMQLNNMGKQKMNELIRKAGQIQCCFLIDLFKSNDKIGNAIIQATETCCKSIKTTTNRESTWGAVCYGYLKSGLSIEKQQFSQSADVLSGFLKRQKILKDPKDQPEDLKTALKSMLTLNWTEKYKLAIVIANSPCHGKKYHNPKKYSRFFGFWSVEYDTKPNDDIEDMIKEVIKKDIVLLVIRFNEETKIMCSELEKLYSRLKYPQLFHTLSVKGLDQKNSDFELVLQIQRMAAFIIGTDNKMTKTKINQQIRLQNFEEGQNDMKKLKEDVVNINNEVQDEMQKQGENKQKDVSLISIQNAIEDKKQYEADVQKVKECTDGALEALCKRGDISNFEKNVQCEDFNCKVFKVELKQESFNKKIETIDQIKYDSDDFDLQYENDWQCIRTKNPFAFGMMKAVYLMKKRNNTEEIYVVKIPIEKGTYKSKAQAVDDCRSHLIAKSLMKDFMEKLRNTNKNGIRSVQYTDFLLLQENENKYWIAERFFRGNFEKYNNNDGYISEEQTELNAISQAFSYFTYQKSSFNYIVNDIQGVENYFTDPAINTTKGNFDETDVGEDGISSYLSTFQMRKGICESLLTSMGIEID